MRNHPTPRFRPSLECLETKLALNAAAATVPPAHLRAGPPALHAHLSRQHHAIASHSAADGGKITAMAKKPNFGYLIYRVTNPPPGPVYRVTPPFGHVLVQARQPVPGQVYNILAITVKNPTRKTFDASSNFLVRLPHQRYTPILKGDEVWKPGQDFIFYALTKQYYPFTNQVSDGFQFKLGGAWSVAVPGPSAIFQRIRYNPNTINKILDFAITKGPGAQGGGGIKFGIPDTALWAFAPSRQNRNDFGGYF